MNAFLNFDSNLVQAVQPPIPNIVNPFAIDPPAEELGENFMANEDLDPNGAHVPDHDLPPTLDPVGYV